MIKFNPTTRARLEALAEYVEIHNEGALRGTDAFSVFSQAQAETYLRWYEGYKREVQEQSIEASLTDPTDPLYGWGAIAQHEPQVRIIGANQQKPIDKTGDAFAEEALIQKRIQSAELLVVKRPRIVPTIPMYILHATVEPTIIPNVSRATIQSRINRVIKKKVRSIGILERLRRLQLRETPEGLQVFVGGEPSIVGGGAGFQIGPIDIK